LPASGSTNFSFSGSRPHLDGYSPGGLLDARVLELQRALERGEHVKQHVGVPDHAHAVRALVQAAQAHRHLLPEEHVLVRVQTFDSRFYFQFFSVPDP